MKNKYSSSLVIVLLVAIAVGLVTVPKFAKKPLPGTPPPGKQTQTAVATTPTLTATIFPSVTISPVVTATKTVTASPTLPSTGNIAPYPAAPACDHSSNDVFHTLWDSVQGCHYDHEHGTSPFIPSVAIAFPGFNLFELLGGVGVGHTNPSSPAENVAKHGGFKWQVDLASQNGPLPVCQQGFENGAIAVKGYALQFHAFGRQDIEHEARNHSSVALLSLCKDGNPNDVGYMYVVQLQEYGQRVMPYQGFVMPYPDNFQPVYISPRGPYFTTECEKGDGNPTGVDYSFVDLDGNTRLVDCRVPGDTQNNNNTIWTSKPTQSAGPSGRPETSGLLRWLFRGRDNYQHVDMTDIETLSDLVHPFPWSFVCGDATFNPTGCRYNSSTMTVQEIMGDIPAAWDGLAGFDTDTRPGRITAEGFVTQFGNLRQSCTSAYSAVYTMTLDGMIVTDPGCYPIKLVSAFVGRYSSELSVNKVSNPDPFNTPERDIYFCNGVPCSETSPGAVPSGWIGSQN